MLVSPFLLWTCRCAYCILDEQCVVASRIRVHSAEQMRAAPPRPGVYRKTYRAICRFRQLQSMQHWSYREAMSGVLTWVSKVLGVNATLLYVRLIPKLHYVPVFGITDPCVFVAIAVFKKGIYRSYVCDRLAYRQQRRMPCHLSFLQLLREDEVQYVCFWRRSSKDETLCRWNLLTSMRCKMLQHVIFKCIPPTSAAEFKYTASEVGQSLRSALASQAVTPDLRSLKLPSSPNLHISEKGG